jgi:hypothetical protein
MIGVDRTMRSRGVTTPMRMSRPLLFLFVVLALALLSVAPAARADDAAYCATLSESAYRYLATCATNGESKPDLETRTAIEDCHSGKTAAGIAVLERKLASNGFTLPKRP